MGYKCITGIKQYCQKEMRKKKKRENPPHMNIFNNFSAEAWTMLIHSGKCSQLLQSVFSGRKVVSWKKNLLTLQWNLLGSLFIWAHLLCFVLWKTSWIQHSSKLPLWSQIITWIALAPAVPSVQVFKTVPKLLTKAVPFTKFKSHLYLHKHTPLMGS